jgi:hypothetical protein
MVEVMPVSVDAVVVSVRVHMLEVRRLEQGDVGEDLGRRPRRDDPMLLREHDAAVGELVESSEVAGPNGERDARKRDESATTGRRCTRPYGPAISRMVTCMRRCTRPYPRATTWFPQSARCRHSR